MIPAAPLSYQGRGLSLTSSAMPCAQHRTHTATPSQRHGECRANTTTPAMAGVEQNRLNAATVSRTGCRAWEAWVTVASYARAESLPVSLHGRDG